MTGNLHRLYTYAKTRTDAKEDFSTEALAIAIRHEPRPFVEAVSTLGLLPEGDLPIEVIADTQLSVPGMGRVDLLVRFGYATAVVERWFEVKVDAGETGDQLDRYRAYIASLPPAVRPTLVMLARRPIRADTDIPFLSWRTVHAVARSSQHPHWQDLADWLEDLGMARQHDGSIDPSELAALAPAVALYEKLCATLATVVGEAGARYPGYAWPATTEVRQLVERELSFRGRFMIRVNPQASSLACLYFGAWATEGRTELGLWVEGNPKYGAQRRLILDAADHRALPGSWERRLATYQALICRIELAGAISQDDLAQWYLDRMEELHAAGILELLPRLGRGMTAAG